MEPKMADPVKPRRTYDSTRRQEQARQNRAAVLAAAKRQFLARGYGATTIGDVAEEAGVSVQTVYKVFANKPGLLKAVVDVALVGDDEPVPMMDREAIQRMRAEPDARRVLTMYGEHCARVSGRAAPILMLVRVAAQTDTGAAEVWDQLQRERLTGMTAFARDLAGRGALRTDVSWEQARDLLWTHNSIEVYDLLVVQRGWSKARYGRFVGEALNAALLPPAPAPPG
jgi:AcrR family transcriptional regulator